MQARKRKKQNKDIVNLKNSFLFLGIIFFVFFFSYLRAVNSPAGIDQKRGFIIERGQNVSSISEDLYKEGLIRSKFFFKVYLKLFKDDLVFREGSYILNYNMSAKEIATEFSKSKTLKPEKEIRFIEGWTLRDYAKILEEKEFFSSNNFFELTGEPILGYKSGSSVELKDYSELFDFLADKPDERGLEGYLFPDTYRFFEDSSADDVVVKMLDNFDQKLSAEMKQEIKRQGKTVYEIITMASIVEKEVQSEKDMKMVSGIFWNRIKNGQALESCATLAYILGVNKAQYSFEDTRVPSSYNTYINKGLPPGPISNPGVKAIEAAIYPEKNNYNYFLSRPDNKETIFSKTYDEHISNKNKYLK